MGHLCELCQKRARENSSGAAYLTAAGGKTNKALDALQRKGAFSWPNPASSHELVEALDVKPAHYHFCVEKQRVYSEQNRYRPGHQLPAGGDSDMTLMTEYQKDLLEALKCKPETFSTDYVLSSN